MPFKRATNCAITPSFVCRIIVLHFESVVNNTTAVCTKLVAMEGKTPFAEICEITKAPPPDEVFAAKSPARQAEFCVFCRALRYEKLQTVLIFCAGKTFEVSLVFPFTTPRASRQRSANSHLPRAAARCKNTRLYLPWRCRLR